MVLDKTLSSLFFFFFTQRSLVILN
jgi:hypothetical protein